MAKAEWRTDPYFRAKAKLYVTAKVRSHIFTNNGERDIPTGDYVAIRYIGERMHPWFHAAEPMFLATHNGEEWGALGADALEEFCL